MRTVELGTEDAARIADAVEDLTQGEIERYALDGDNVAQPGGGNEDGGFWLKAWERTGAGEGIGICADFLWWILGEALDHEVEGVQRWLAAWLLLV